MTLYLIVSLLAVAGSLFIFFESVIVSVASIAPIAFIGISVIQAVMFGLHWKEKRNNASDTAYTTHELDLDAVKLSMKYHCFTKLAVIPLLTVFVIYFDDVFKLIIPVCLYFLSFLPVGLLVRFGGNK